jgi:wyosine [tRNA(Phe)-imidazoG37] synthetase (radical SAM superfamily)
MRTMDFVDHSRKLGDFRYIYAVISRRSGGLSIGVNLNPDKVCNFACPYCQVDRTTPGGGRDVDLDTLQGELDQLLGLVASGEIWQLAPYNTAAPHLQRVNDIAVAGDGEPTTAKNLRGALEAVATARNRHGLDDVKLFLLTNATMLHRKEVQEALDVWDAAGGSLWAKLDAGDAEQYKLVNDAQMSFEKVCSNLHLATKRWRVIIQSMQMTWDGVAPTDQQMQSWAAVVESLVSAGGAIEQVQIYTIARAPADPRCGPLTRAQLSQFGERIAHLDLPVLVAGSATES